MKKIYEQYGGLGVFCVIGIALAIVFGALCLDAWIASMLWDWVIVNTLGWVAADAVGFWEMLGLIMLCNILFKPHNLGKNENKKDNE